MTPSPNRRRLADELVAARRRAGLTGRDMARALALSQAQLYRYDHAVTTPTIPKVRAWLDICAAAEQHSVSDEDRARVLALAEQAHAEPRTWKAMADAGVTNAQPAAAEQDEEAAEEWSAQCVILPGLVQTPEYAAAAVRRADLHGQFDHTAQVRDRLVRQALLFEPGRRWNFVIAERLLTWSPGAPALMPAQRARLLALAETNGIDVAVLPDGALLEPSGLWWVPFTVIEPRAGGRYVVIEDTSGERVIRDGDELESWTLLWERLWAAAARGDDALSVIRDASSVP